MASEIVTFEDLARYHREVIAPEFEQAMERRLSPLIFEMVSLRETMTTEFSDVRAEIGETRAHMLTHFDSLYARLDRMATEHDVLDASVRRVEDRVTALEHKHS